MPTLDRLVDVRPVEFAHGLTHLAMRRSRASFVAVSVFGLLLLLAVVVFAWVHGASGSGSGSRTDS